MLGFLSLLRACVNIILYRVKKPQFDITIKLSETLHSFDLIHILVILYINEFKFLYLLISLNALEVLVYHRSSVFRLFVFIMFNSVKSKNLKQKCLNLPNLTIP